MFMGEKFGRDSIWEGHLATELWSTKLDIDAVLDQQVMSLREVRNFQVGQTLLLNAEPQSEVELRSGNVPLFKGRMGRKNNKIAVQVDRLLSRHERNGQAG
jgi:flagellar motor switch protein FliM